jgi:hypothetical protein
MNTKEKIPQMISAKTVKEFFSRSLNGMFSSGTGVQSGYGAGDISDVDLPPVQVIGVVTEFR